MGSGISAIGLWPLAAALAAGLGLGLLAGFALWRTQRARRRRADRVIRGFAAFDRPAQIVGRAGELLDSNEAARQAYGRSGVLPEELGVRARDEEMRERLVRLAGKAARGLGGREEVVLAEGGGEQRWIEVEAHGLGHDSGEVMWIAQDVTDRRQIEQTMAEERDRLLDLFEYAPVGVYSVEASGRFEYVNATLANWLGRSRGELLGGLSLRDVLAEPAEDLPAYLPFGGGDRRRGEADFLDAAGGRFRVSITQEVLEDGPGRLRTRSVVRHLAQERAAENALAQGELRFRRFLDEAPIGVAQLDAEGVVVEHNKTFASMVAGERTLTGRPLADFLIESDRSALATAMTQVGTADGTAAEPLEVRLGGARDTVCQLTLRGAGAGAGGGGAIVHLLDLTEQKALEAQFAQSQKMQAVGQLAGGIAHDFNNLLTAMIGFSDLLLLRHRPGDQSFADIMQIKQNANRAANLVRQLLAFSRQQTLQPKVLNVTDVLAELAHLLRRLIGEAIEFKVVHGRGLGTIRADQGQLEQVIINLVVNARDAMAATGGELAIRTANLALPHERRIGGDVMPAGRYVTIEVSDTGCGIPKEIMGRIFDPFFSTKEVGEGTGLGLATVYGIVKQTGGFVGVESSVGRGTTFSIHLPEHLAAPGPAVLEASENRDLSGIGKVMLVEDEDAVRAFSARVLRTKGYEVMEARSGEAALELLRGGAGAVDIDLLVTDVVMPKVDGPALVKVVREHHPTLKVIFISGYAEDSFRRRIGEESGIYFLAKPFSLKQLASKVKEVMGER
ncbi:MAG: ATP-binding protein [Tistlia sp.]|uniref:ATP-binding protein n=1 Tax=Tistlia sp. TaxID=3057121 RepID=UPI0034A1F3B9